MPTGFFDRYLQSIVACWPLVYIGAFNWLCYVHSLRTFCGIQNIQYVVHTGNRSAAIRQHSLIGSLHVCTVRDQISTNVYPPVFLEMHGRSLPPYGPELRPRVPCAAPQSAENGAVDLSVFRHHTVYRGDGDASATRLHRYAAEAGKPQGVLQDQQESPVL